MRTRRDFILLGLTLGAGIFPDLSVLASEANDDSVSPTLKEMIRHSLLVHSLYRLPVSRNYAPDGAAGVNVNGYQWIEEQRQGAEWIVRGYAQDNQDWISIGWRLLDWGLDQQQTDGSFASKDAFHSTSFFIEALARSCIIDPTAASARRVDGLARGARWLMRGDVEEGGSANIRPYTHRRYILAAAFGQTAAVTGEKKFAERAAAWAREGLALQQGDGTNPEKNGFDASYQMVGVLMSLRYLPVCGVAGLRKHLRSMIRNATLLELRHQNPDGSIDAEGSTRIGKEHSRAGITKSVSYGEVLQALVYGAQALPQPEWISPAERIASYQKWLK